ncbi:MAG: MCP four helix bundle domain-containing protein [Myxococcota bacterium]
MKLSTRIAVSFAFAALVMLGLGVSSFWGLYRANDALHETFEGNLMPIELLGRASTTSQKTIRRVSAWFFGRSVAEKEEALRQLAQNDAEFESSMAEYARRIDHVEDRELHAKAMSAWAAWKEKRGHIFELDRNGTNTKAALNYFLDEARPKLVELDKIIAEMTELNRKDAQRERAPHRRPRQPLVEGGGGGWLRGA